MKDCSIYRTFMKSKISNSDYKLKADISQGIAQPDFQKPFSNILKKIDLPIINSESAPKADYFDCVCKRISRRSYTIKPLSLCDLSFLLWCTQGLKR